MWHQPKGYYKAWKMKINNQLTSKNIWKTFEKDELQGWLVFVLNNMVYENSKENLNLAEIRLIFKMCWKCDVFKQFA